jgi:hypothetical protein
MGIIRIIFRSLRSRRGTRATRWRAGPPPAPPPPPPPPPRPAPAPDPDPDPAPDPDPEPDPEPEPDAPLACDRVVPRGQREVSRAAAGEVLCLEPGTRGELRLFGLQGTAARPITIVNDGGVVDIRARGAYAGIEIRDSSHLRITGTGVVSQCGAGVGESEQRCGIRISPSSFTVGASAARPVTAWLIG